MSKNNINVNVFADTGYAVWTAPVRHRRADHAAAGQPRRRVRRDRPPHRRRLTEAHNYNETKIYDMAGSLVRIARNQEERPWTFVALEGNNIVDSLRYPGSSVVNTGGTAEVQTVTLTGTGTAGTWSLTSPNYGTAAGLAYNISMAALQTALTTAFGVTIPLPTGTAGTSYVITFPVVAGNVGPMTATNNITGVTAITVATTTPGVTGTNTRAVGAGLARNLRVWCIDLVDGSVHKRIVMNSAEATWTGNVSYNGAGAAQYEFTLQPYKDTSGNFYSVIDDNSADAEAFA
jgi:hypothetical protein